MGERPISGASVAPTLRELGWDDGWRAWLARNSAGGEVGRVVRHDGAVVLVADGESVSHRALGTDTPTIAVGDWVVVDADRVLSVLPRRSILRRRGASTGAEQLVAANLDRVGLVCALDRTVSPGTIERLTTLGWDSGATPMLVFTKSDLDHDHGSVAALASAAAPGIDQLFVAASDGHGINDLRSGLVGSTVAFIGSSGAGKSTLVNALARHDLAATAEVRAGDRKGRHTTTARQLHVIADDICVIDTPGVRKLGVWTDVDTVDEVFEDLSELGEQCRFSDYAHSTEPGCAVREALDDGSLTRRRFEAWEALRREAASAELRSDPAARHRVDRQQGRVYREAQRMKRRHR